MDAQTNLGLYKSNVVLFVPAGYEYSSIPH